MSREQTAKVLLKKVKEVHDLIEECKALAEKHDLTFQLDPGYSMGGTYYSKGAMEAYGINPDEDWRYQEGWLSSTNSCR